MVGYVVGPAGGSVRQCRQRQEFTNLSDIRPGTCLSRSVHSFFANVKLTAMQQLQISGRTKCVNSLKSLLKHDVSACVTGQASGLIP